MVAPGWFRDLSRTPVVQVSVRRGPRSGPCGRIAKKKQPPTISLPVEQSSYFTRTSSNLHAKWGEVEKLRAVGFMWEFTADRVRHFFRIAAIGTKRKACVFEEGQKTASFVSASNQKGTKRNDKMLTQVVTLTQVRWHKERSVHV